MSTSRNQKVLRIARLRILLVEQPCDLGAECVIRNTLIGGIVVSLDQLILAKREKGWLWARPTMYESKLASLQLGSVTDGDLDVLGWV